METRTDLLPLSAPLLSSSQTGSHTALGLSPAPVEIGAANLVFIDSAVEDLEQLVAGVVNAEVVLLDPNQDGVAQITTVLSQRRDLDSIHVVSHGSAAQLALGNTHLNGDTLDAYANDLQGWSQALSEDADVLFYGCSVGHGPAGAVFVDQLGDLIGADIAASDDLTGSAALGGDWHLEVTTGAIEAVSAFSAEVMQTYDEVYDTTVSFDDFADTSGLTLNGNAAPGGDNALRLTPALSLQGGSAFLNDAIEIGANTSFTSTFEFRLSEGQGTDGADGFTFVIQNNSADTLGGRAGGLGYSGIGNSIAVEFDTFFNGGIDPNNNHVSILQDGDVLTALAASTTPLDLNSGNVLTAWVDYNGATDRLEVFLSDNSIKPESALVSTTLDLEAEVGSSGFVGFSAGTGGVFNAHDIESWQFTSVTDAGILVLPTSGLVTTEAGGTANFEVVLNSEPIADVTIDLSSSDPTEGSLGTPTLTFTPDNWDVAQTVTVTGIDDDLEDGDVPYTIVTAAAVSSDSDYSGLDAANVALTNIDDDGGVPTGINFTDFTDVSSLTLNGNATQGGNNALRLTPAVSLQGGSAFLNDAIDIGANTSFSSTFEFRLSEGQGTDGADGFAFVIQNNSANALGGRAGGLGYSGIGNSIAVEFDTFFNGGIDPNNNHVSILQDGDVLTALAASTTPLDLNSGNVLTAWVDYNGATDRLEVFLSDNSIKPELALVSTTLDLEAEVGSSGFVGFSAGTGGLFNAHDIESWQFTSTADAGISVTPTSGLVTTEAGETADFEVVLNSQPTADVTIDLSSSDPSEGSLATSTLTFTPDNWDMAQVVTVTGVDDDLEDGDVPYTIVTAAASSDDPAYSGLDPEDVAVTNTDDDTVPQTAIDFTDFTDISDLTLNGNATQGGNDALRLTPALDLQGGSAFFNDAIAIVANTSFTSTFEFRLSEGQGTDGADGFTFVIQNNSANALGGRAGGLGYSGIGNSIAVEFDTFFNTGIDPSDNHVSILQDGNVLTALAASTTPLDLNSGDVLTAWVDYNGLTDQLEVFLADSDLKPDTPLVSTTVNLTAVVGASGFVGFSAGTGGLVNAHDIESWQFNTSLPNPGDIALGISDVIVNEADGTATVTVVRTGGSDGTVTVDYTTVDSFVSIETSATAGDDYLETAGTLTFAPGDTSQTVDIAIIEDGEAEFSETFGFTIDNVTGGAQLSAPRTAVITITDNDGLDIDFPDFTDASSLTLNGSASQVDNILRLTADLPAQNGSAFLTEAIDIDGDTFFSTQFQFQLGGEQGTTGADGFAFILQNNSAQSLGGNGGGLGYSGIPNSVAVEFDTFFNPGFDPSDNNLSVLLNGNVIDDLNTTTPTLDLNGGEVLTAWIDYDQNTELLEVFLADTEIKPDTPVLSEALDLAAVLGDNAFVGFSAGTGGLHNTHDILNWNFSSSLLIPAVEFAPSAVLVNENEGTATLTVERIGTSFGTVLVDYATQDGSAIADADYTPITGTLTFESGESFQTLTVPILNDDLGEGNESFAVTLSNPIGIELGAEATTIINITDDDGAFISETIATGLNGPTAIDWTPDGQTLFVAERTGVVRIVRDGTLLAEPLIDISDQVSSVNDRGLLDIAVHPDFENNPYVYLLYAFDPPEVFLPESTDLAGPDQSGNRTARLTRVTVDNSVTPTVASPDSEVVILGTNSVWENISGPDIDSTFDFDQPPSGVIYDFTVTYSDDLALDLDSLGDDDILVTGPNGFNQLAQFVSVDDAGLDQTQTATYRLDPPGGSWNLEDNGTYVITLQADQVLDTSGNGIAETLLGNFGITLGLPATLPTAALSTSDTIIEGETTHRFTVTYLDDTSAIDLNSLDHSDVLVTGPNGFSQLATLENIIPASDDNPLTVVTYQINAPGGRWEADDDGIYAIALQPDQVSDADGNFSPASFLGNFAVSLGTPADPTLPLATLATANVGDYIQDFLAADSRSHTIGTVAFGPDGALYVSNGDGTSFNQVDPRTVRVQDLNSLSGKVLRIDPITGEGLPDNPFYDNDPDSNRSKVFQYGLRNPFRFAIDPEDGQLFIGDVGWTLWEEIDASGPGANFGWPYFEGGNGENLAQTGGYQDLSETQAFFASSQEATPGILGLNHLTDDINAIILGDVYRGNAYPTGYEGDVFYNNFDQGIVSNVSFDDAGNIVAIDTFATDAQFVVQMLTGPDENLYFVNIVTGEIGRWVFDGEATIGDLVWNDLDGDGIRDAEEPGIDGVTVELFADANRNGELDVEDQFIEAQTTANGGAYDFTSLLSGDYLITVTDTGNVLDGFVLTGGTEPFVVNLAPGEDFDEGDFGYQQQNASIGDLVWNDLDGDGTQDPEELGIDGVSVELFADTNGNGELDPEDQFIATQTTAADGTYDFTDLASGDYLVTVTDTDTVLDGFVLTGGTEPLVVNLAAGEDFNDSDFGYQQQDASIGDLIWNDLDGDGTQDPEELGLDGVTVELFADANGDGELDADDQLLATQTTADGGAYDFTGLASGDYLVSVTDTGNVLDGFVLTGGTEPLLVNLAAGEDFDGGDFGYQQQNASIGDVVWNDLDGDGTQDPQELGLDGVTVELFADTNGDGELDAGDQLLATQTTADGGAYDFTGLVSGDYLVSVTDTESRLVDYELTGGTEPLLVNLAAGEDFNEGDFGYQQSTSSIRDWVRGRFQRHDRFNDEPGAWRGRYRYRGGRQSMTLGNLRANFADRSPRQRARFSLSTPFGSTPMLLAPWLLSRPFGSFRSR